MTLLNPPRRQRARKRICQCGCKGDASWLCTGNDYDPRKPGGKGKEFVDEPACTNAALYLDESASQLGLPFTRRHIDN